MENVIPLLSSSLGHTNSEANIALAREIAASGNTQAIQELVDHVVSKDKRLASDCIKVLYEASYIKPGLLSNHVSVFLGLITNENNRLVWGSMVVLASISKLCHTDIFSEIDTLIEVVEKGSVITIDCGIQIFANLNCFEEYQSKVEPVLTEILWTCPIKQLPQYIEKSLVCINSRNKEQYLNILEKRVNESEKESQKKRLNKAKKLILEKNIKQ